MCSAKWYVWFGGRSSVRTALTKAIGLYRDVWIAAIASSRTRLATLTGAMCNANYVRYA